MRVVMVFAAVLLVAILGFAAYVRLAPTDPARWQVDISTLPGLDWTRLPVDATGVVALPNGAMARLTLAPDQAPATLAKLDAAALATPRTIRLAGSAAEGRVTWETRSRLWGFPDYTTAQITVTGAILIYARQRFGSKDLGVNAARLQDWLARL
ncbi:DUF1499 domain-containing protein [bacterium]|nr:DUF1499 domain-containing protein [bacterium]